MQLFRAVPSHFKNLVFVSVGVIDSGGFKGAEAVEALGANTELPRGGLDQPRPSGSCERAPAGMPPVTWSPARRPLVHSVRSVMIR
jgi:hypothetical protein